MKEERRRWFIGYLNEDTGQAGSDCFSGATEKEARDDFREYFSQHYRHTRYRILCCISFGEEAPAERKTQTPSEKRKTAAPTAKTADGAYGVEWDYSKKYPALTRKGLAASFADPEPAESTADGGFSPFDDIMPWAGMKKYNIINGAAAYSEDDPEFSMTDYDTMVYIPEFYYTAYKDTQNGKWLWAISPEKLDGFEKHPGSGRFVGRYHTSGTEYTMRSVSKEYPLTYVSQKTFRAGSKAKGEHWYMLDLATWSAIQMLYLVEFANFDSQTVLGGGWNTWEIGRMGGTDSAAYHTIKATGAHNQYRNIEDPFSNVLDWIDGFLGSTRNVYVGTDNAGFDGSTAELTKAGGIKLPGCGWTSGFGYSEESAWAFIPDTAAGSDSTFVCDYVSSYSSARPANVGGSYYAYACYGMFYLSASFGASNSSAHLGSRLLFDSAGGLGVQTPRGEGEAKNKEGGTEE